MSLLRDRLEQRIAGLLAQHTDAIVHAWLKLGFLIPEVDALDTAEPLLREVTEQSPFAVAGILRERGLLGLTAAEATKGGAPIKVIGPPLPTAAELAARVETNILSAAARLIPDDTERGLTIERKSLSQDWPLEAGPAWVKLDATYIMALAVLASMEDRSRGGQAWPPSIAPLAVADTLDAAGDEPGRVVADAIRNGYPVLFPPRQEEHAKNLEFFRWYRGEPGREGLLSFGLVQWNPAAVAVLLAALNEVRPAPLAESREQVVRAPSPVIAAMVAARSGMTKAGHLPAIVDPSGKTFPAAGFRHWQFTGPKGHSLWLPFPSTPSTTTKGKLGKMEVDPGIPAREALPGGLLLAYVTTWALWHQQGGKGSEGLFLFEPARVAELAGYALTARSDRPGSAPRARSGAVRHFAAQLDKLTTYGLAAVGDVKAKTVEPLINRYESPRGEVYQHAPLAIHAMRRDFTQLPLAVLRLDARDAPIAVGMAAFWREHIVTTLDGAGHWRGTLRDLLVRLGAFNPAEARKRSPGPYLQGLARDLERIVAEGELGSAHTEGSGPGAIVTLTPSPILATVYEPLRAARLAAAARAEAVAVEVAVRRALPGGARRAPGRKTAKG